MASPDPNIHDENALVENSSSNRGKMKSQSKLVRISLMAKDIELKKFLSYFYFIFSELYVYLHVIILNWVVVFSVFSLWVCCMSWMETLRYIAGKFFPHLVGHLFT